MTENQNVLRKKSDPSGIALISTLLNIFVAGSKGVLAWLSGSSALLADTIHGFSDTLASFLVLVGYLIRIREEGHIVEEETILRNPYLKEEKGKGIKVSEWLIRNDIDAVCTRKAFDGKGPSYVFSSADVEVIITEDTTVDEIREKLRAPKT